MIFNKRIILESICTALLFYCVVFTANATPYNGADIELSGQDWSNLQHKRWRNDSGSDGIYSPWASWAEYTVKLDAGNWNIGLNVINHGYIAEGTNWYNNFRVKDQFGSILNFTASDSEVNSNFFNYDIASPGQYTFRFTWLNDKWGGSNDRQHRDANIQISSVFFDNTSTPSTAILSTPASIPEPVTTHLFVAGLIGVVASIRRKRKK